MLAKTLVNEYFASGDITFITESHQGIAVREDFNEDTNSRERAADFVKHFDDHLEHLVSLVH